MFTGAHLEVYIVQNHALPARHIHIPQFKKIGLFCFPHRVSSLLVHQAPIHLLD
jgi:hypothetical protein